MRIRKLVSSLLSLGIFLPVFTLSSFAATATLTGKFRTPTGAQFNGYIRFSLPFAGAVDTACDGGGSCLAIPVVTQVQIVNGAFATLATPRLIKNADITPKGTYYHAAVYDSSSRLIATSNFVIGSAASFDVGAALQTSITTNNVSYITPADLNGNNTWTGTNTFNGAVVFNSTVTGLTLPCSSAAAANTVCGNNTGAPANPSFVKVTFSMTDGTTIAPLASPGFTGTPTAPTPTAGDNSTKIATTAFVNTTQTNSKIIAVDNTTPGGGVGITTNTTITTRTITMPSSGCPCRAFAAYQMNFTNIAAGEVAVWVNDGTNNFATGLEHRDGSTGSAFNVDGSAFSIGTYANNAAITFTLKSSQNTGNTVTMIASNGTGGQNSWLDIVIFPSN